MGNPNLQPPVGRHHDAAGLFDQEQPPTVLPKKRGNKTKTDVKKSNLSLLNLGNALDDDNERGDNVIFLGAQFTSNYLIYENVDVYKGYLVPVTFWQQLFSHLCMLDFDSNAPVGWLFGEERVIMYDDNARSTLLEFIVKRFNLDPNILFNLSFNFPAIERDITNDEDVKLIIDCATNSLYEEIPHLYVRLPKVEEYVKKVNENVSEDDNFTEGPWLSAIVHLQEQGVIASGCLGDVDKLLKKEA
nr:hypothetical protein [Tanacetum cinerariifolium]